MPLEGAGSAPPAETASMAETDADRTFLRYHRAIAAAKRCEDMSFADPQSERMSQVIDRATDDGVGGPGRSLMLIREAERDIREQVRRNGCGDDRVTDALALFDRELRPVL